ncbi:hypothetical protein OS493_010745 [Desmophyllum pertusum]|uniref:Uncharacterized protein n=1 Tax=Desmophyllum pertusum TaxID=174260 RepID=A0A9W9ZR79_9CNID|nr:hypothetical protein OS493_010745 [Desmophyllum pertusum]
MAKRKHTCHLISLRYMKIILSTIITLSLFGVIIYWKSSSGNVEHNFRRLSIWNSTPPPYKENLNRSSVCYNVLTQMRNARWIKRANITPIDELQQRNTEIQIRKKRGMPIRLHRDDSRCGGDPFFLASPNFGFPLPALCDVNGSAPCCNHVTQRCGALREYCNCARCTDFRKTIPAELFDWIPFHGGCTFTNFH